MRIQKSLESQITEAVISFTTNHMSLTPDSVFVHTDQQSIVITLHGITCPAEKEYAKEKKSRAILEGFYDEVFEANNCFLETVLANITGQRIEHSKLTIDAKSGSCVIVCTLLKETGDKDYK